SVAGQNEPLGYTRNIVADVLFRHYARVARDEQVDFSVRAELGKDAGIPDAELCAILSNLLENAMEACIRVKSGRRFISITLRQEKAVLSIQMENSTAPMQSDTGDFLSQKAPNRTGYGLRSITATAARYDGEAFFEYDESTGTFMSTVILLVDSEGQ
ncbi:ATP-binding protein, partial [Christensenellaceae bacterium OttesenSCG-928-K19]|nr:ATP-binding protein [Christensenellaceae bacterium OttesenSCG-928-K19]